MTELSAKNPRVQNLRKLGRQRKARDDAGLFVVEGEVLLADAVASGKVPAEVFLGDADAISTEMYQRLEDLRVPIWEVDPDALSAAAPAVSPRPVLATMPQELPTLDTVLEAAPSFLLVGVAISDPGNAGTLIRTAAAAGAQGVVFVQDSVDCFNPKVVRASAGALWHTPVVRNADADQVWSRLEVEAITTVGLAGGGSEPYDNVDLRGRVAVVAGNEAHGFDPATMAVVQRLVHIPMAHGVESLNVAAAAAVVCVEVARQRRAG